MQRKFILRLVLIEIFFTASLFSTILSPAEITSMVSEIKKERVGISLAKLETTTSPFIINVPKKKQPSKIKEVAQILAPREVVYTLKAILNKAAFIDTEWYKQGDSIGDYIVGHISSSSVVLESTARENRILSIEKKKKMFKLNRGYR